MNETVKRSTKLTKIAVTTSSASEKMSSYKDALNYSPSTQPMFRSLIPYFNLQMQICNRIGLCAFVWNNQIQRVSLQPSQRRMKLTKIEVSLLWAYTLFMLGYFVTPFSLKKNDMKNKLIGSVFLSSFIATMLMNWQFFEKRKEIVGFWNSLLGFEECHLPRKIN
jgi:hypothetical protein